MYKVIDKDYYEVINEDSIYPFIISIPHSGIYIDKYLNDNMNKDMIMTNVDWYLDKLYSFLKDLGYTIIINNISRYVIDVNRKIDICTNNYKKDYIYTKTTWNKDIYKINPNIDIINNRINTIYNPYHNKLLELINNKKKYHKEVYLIDLHSFGMDLDYDIVLGNVNNTSINLDMFNKIKDLFINNGFNITMNNPYPGGYITRYYSSICNTLQIELNYKKYIDNRIFLEEYMPSINNKIFNECQNKLEIIFNKLKDEDDY